MLHPELVPGLYLVATPIGTAGDITLRALDILARADVLAAEDTRQARKLMEIHGIRVGDRLLLPYHDHNGAAQRPRLLELVRQGKSLAYVSDAGTPLVADPGFKLAEAMIAEGLPVTSAPGASALLAALSLAGLPTDRFTFAGFLPATSAARKSALRELAAVPTTLVLFESPRRLGASLADMAEILGDRRAAVCRELTKKFEEVSRGTLKELALASAGKQARGEHVIVVGPPLTKPAADGDITDALASALRDNSVKDAARIVSDTLGVPRKIAYAEALKLHKGKS